MIISWLDIKDAGWESLLIGNGFSIGVSGRFRYDSLLRMVDDLGVGMYPHARSLFDESKIGTSNFEEILKVIYHAYLVNFYNLDAIKQLYFNVQKSLIEVVSATHVPFNEVPANRIASALLNYKKIYTTNYDLIPYWSMLDGAISQFCDFFWQGSCEFDLANVNVWGGKTPIYYLHGAVHLRSNPQGRVCKVIAADSKSLSSVVGSSVMGDTPLFISEGKSDLKLRKIKSNYYLNFCYESLLECDEGIVVYGHGLDMIYDEHILKALKLSKLKKIAISVCSGLGFEAKMAFASNIKSYFADVDKELYFFESDTHPLSLPKANSCLELSAVKLLGS